MQRAEAERVLSAARFMGTPMHPKRADLERFMRGELARAEAVLVVRHMLAGCAECREVTRPLWELMEKKPRCREDHP